MVTAALQILFERPQRGAERVQIVAARAQIVVDEDGVRLVVGLKLGGDLLRMPHAIGHAQAVGREIAEAAAVVAAAGGDQAGRGQKTVAREESSGAAEDRRGSRSHRSRRSAAASVFASTSRRIRGQSCTPSPSASASACGAHSSGQESTCSPPKITFAPRARYQSASS